MKAKTPRCHKEHGPRDIICRGCELYQKETNYNCLGGTGFRRADIFILGEKISQIDDRSGKPFGGREGSKLDYFLKRAGINPSRVYRTQVLKCYDKRDAKSPLKKHYDPCMMHLKEELQWVNPKVVVAMGNGAFHITQTDTPSVYDWRGFPLSFRGQKTGEHKFWVMPTYSINYASKMPEADGIVVRDFMVAKALAEGLWEPRPIDMKLRVLTSLAEIEKAEKEIAELQHVSFDLETTGLDFWKDDITCFVFAAEDGRSWVIPYKKEFDSETKEGWKEGELPKVKEAVARILMNDVPKEAHNGKFDLKFLWKEGLTIRKYNFDTMYGHALIEPDKPQDLVFCGQWQGVAHEKWDAPLEAQFKKMGKRDYRNLDSKMLFKYAGYDGVVTARLRRPITKKLKETGTLKVFNEWTIKRLIPMLSDMEYRGAHIDLKSLNVKAEQIKEEMGTILAEIRTITKNENFKPLSPKDIKEFLFSRRIKLQKTTKAGNLSVDESVLQELASAGRGYGVPEKILLYRSLSKTLSTYLSGKDGMGGLRGGLDYDHYIHTDYKPSGTYTGRLSSADPNLQNIPNVGGIRELFIPDASGDLFAGVDYKQLEVRIAAALSKDPVLIKEILENVDMHSRNAALFLMKMSEVKFQEVYKNKDHPDYHIYENKRRVAKAVTFGVLYGSTAEGVATRNNVPLEEAAVFIKKFFRKYSKLNEWIKRQHRYMRQTHKVISPTGRFYKFNDLRWCESKFCDDWERNKRLQEADRVSVNMPIQGYGSDIFQYHKHRFWHELKKRNMKSRLVLTIHDGFIANVKPDEKDLVDKLIPETMNLVLNEGTKYAVPLEVEVDYTDKWLSKA